MPSLRSRWRAEVYRSPYIIADSTRVLLLLLADRMALDGTVSVPRRELAELLGRNERRITERMTAACRAGYLEVVEPGRVGRTAVYRATFP